jgi:hypothetical protein
MSAIDNLQNSIIKAAGKGAFALDAAFLTAGLADPNVSVPPDYDKNLQAAFQVASAAKFLVTASAGDVGPVADDSFTVNNATIPFLGSNLQGAASLVFALTADGKTLVVQIASSPANWTWTDSFKFMGGFPFNQLPVSAVQFVFSTSEGNYPWGDSNGQNVVAGTVQNFSSQVPLPTLAQPLLVLFTGLKAPSGNLILSGAFDLSTYNGKTVLFPAVTLDALLDANVFQMLYLTVSRPRVNLTIPAPADAEGASASDTMQTPTLSVATDIKIGLDTSPYILKVGVTPPISSASTNSPFSITLMAKDDATPLTPSTIISLVGGGASYLSATPPVLQQFLAMVGLQGLTLAGTLGTPSNLSAIGVRIGSSKNTSWTPLPSAPAGLNFTITSFYLDWTLMINGQQKQQTFLMGAQFTLMPSVFKGPDGEGNGIFKVRFTSDLQFSAEFDGTATLGDFLSTLTGGAVSLSSDVNLDAKLSQIRLAIDFNEQSFSFSSGFEITLAFLTVGGKPIISITDGEVSVAAKTATQDKNSNGNSSTALVPAANTGTSTTVWQSGISGLMAVGPLSANVSIAYDGFETPARWNLNASLAEEIDVKEIIQQFFDPNGTYQFPTFLPGTLKIKTFAIDAVIPSGEKTVGDEQLSTSYSIDTTFSWLFQLGQQTVGIDPAKIGLKYDGSKLPGQQFSGLAEGTWVYQVPSINLNLKLLMGYQFEQTKDGSNTILYVQWEGFRAQYVSGKDQEKVVFTLKGWSLGTLIQAIVRTLGNPYYVLPSPWDLLNQVSLDGLSVEVSLKTGEDLKMTAKYTLSSPLNLGFIIIKGINFFRASDGKVNLALNAQIPSVLLSSVPPEDKKKLQSLTDPNKGQDVNNLPSVPGRGEEYFKLFLLVLGQRVGITGESTFESTKQVICALENVPNTTGKTNPVNPNANQGSPPKGLPYYNQGSNWLIAGHLGLLKVAGAWTVDAMFVFNDPNLYGMRLALAGAKAGGLAGLSVDVLYKKITDDIGVFQIEFTFPDSIRNLNFGAVSITLPQIGIKVYTNGDFFIDIGFPYNLDFRRSFSIAAIIYGVPVLGSGGFYFGKLSNATATQIPKTNNGTFDPVIIFGLGLQLGLGYNFTKGPLSAGFALTVFGIVEGVIAAWHPYDRSDQSLALRAQRPKLTNEMMLTGASDSALQSDYYFKLSGTVGVIGLLYGKIDFAIIQASLNVKITLSLQITYESYRSIPLIARVTVDVSLTVKINLGLFSISFSLSFSADVSAKFVIGEDSKAPWDDSAPQFENFMTRSSGLLSGGPVAARLRANLLQPRQKLVVGMMTDVKPTLTLLVSPPFTVLAPEGATDYSQQEGAFALLFAMDAPDATSKEPPTGTTSFDYLCAAFFPWVIDTVSKSEGDEVDLQEASAVNVTRTQLETYIHKLADLDNPPLNIAGLLGFLGSAFILDIETQESVKGTAKEDAMKAGTMVFPVFDGLSLSVPNKAGSGDDSPVTFETYTTATSGYRKTVSQIFAEVEAVIEKENESSSRMLAAVDDDESMAALIFVDAFLMIGRQLLQAALNLLDSYAYPLDSNGSDTIQGIMNKINAAGNSLTPNDVSLPNKDHAMSPNIKISVDGLKYAIQATDTLTKIASKYSDSNASPRWKTTEASIIEANGMSRILQPNVPLTLTDKDNKSVPYTTIPGDYFQNIADFLNITLSQLAAQSVLYSNAELLAPSTESNIPAITYTTAPAVSSGQPSPDTLNSVAAFFATTVSRLANDNLTVSGIFSPAAEKGVLTLANLTGLQVESLWSAIKLTDQVAQTAGMVSRFMMFGLRLPVAPGLTLSGQFLYPTQQTQYALYQLTGQQFPTPPTSEKYEITISRADKSHDVDLSFIQFNGTADKSASIDLTDAFNLLTPVLNYAKSGNFQPSPSFQVEPLSTRAPREFALNTFAYWSTSDIANLQALTDRSGVNTEAENAGSQVQPTLWALPASLYSMIEARQASLSGQLPNLSDVLPLLPAFTPQVGNTSPATNTTVYTDIKNWAWTTRVDFQVKKLPSAVTAVEGTGADSTPSGPASAPALPNVYEVVGPTSEDALRLEQLLTAMDELGTNLVSSVSLLYQPGGDTSPKLVTLGEQEFLSFLTQTNLSTETNPPGALTLMLAEADVAPPRGIANSPAEFIKLLWELSVVRSGGYYLFYQVVNGGDGLPASIFDSSGTATLSMIVTYSVNDSQSLPGNALLNCVNSFVVTDSIDTSQDIMRLVSKSAEGSGAALKGEETLDWLSSTYGPGPGRIAETNPTQSLTIGKVIHISGIVRQLQQGDVVNPTQTLTNLANYYSVGAVKAITAADIQNFNPGVTVGLGAVFYIPPVDYKVATAAQTGTAPGNTFPSIAAYYSLSVDAVAVLALNVTGIFPQDAKLKIDSQLFDLRSTLGPRNVGIQLERVNPGSPDSGDMASYPEKYLYQMYNTLSAGFQKNVFFGQSPLGLPFGPQMNGGDSNDAAQGSQMQLQAQRRARLQAAAEADFDYRQALGLTQNFTLINAAPAKPADGLPPQADNPYIGVGSTAQVALRWQDILGNITITPFEKEPAGYKGALNGESATILYNDRLIGLSNWTNVQASYIYANDNGPNLQLSLTLDTTNYTELNDQVKKDFALYQLIYFQLHQDYTNLGVPGVTGNAVSMSITNSLLKKPLIDLGDKADTVRQFVSECVQFLYALVNGSQLPAQPKATLSLPVSLDDINPGNIIELDVELILTRKAELTEPSVAALNEGLSVKGAIFPKADGVETVSYTEFAKSFEEIFQNAQWEMKVGEGLRQTDQGEDNSTQQLWAARFGKVKGAGIYFEISDSPSYYAPKPVAKSLQSQQVEIVNYKTGEQSLSHFTGVDLNLWFQTCLDAIDAFLAADYSSSAFILDKILGVNDPLGKDGYLGQVLATKQLLADTISTTVKPVLSTSAVDDSSIYAAQEKLRQQLLNQLGAAYKAGTVTVMGLSDVSGAPASTPAGPPSLYGQPAGTLESGAQNQNFTISPAKLPLGEITVLKDGVPVNYDPRLAFIVTSKNMTSKSGSSGNQPNNAYVPLNDLKYQVTHLEFDRTEVQGITGGYVQSRWMQFVRGPFDYQLGNTTSNIPIVNRALPTPPTVQKQTATKFPNPVTPSDLAKWTYSFDYFYSYAPGDAVETTIELNYQSNGSNLLRGELLFGIEPDYADDLDAMQIGGKLSDIFQEKGYNLTPKAGVKINRQGNEWTINDVNRRYKIHKEDEMMSVYAAVPDLFGALAQFISSYPAILADFNEYLRKIDAEEQNQTTIDNAKKAVSTFEQYVANVAQEYALTMKPVSLAAMKQVLEMVKITFEIALDDDDGNARTNILNLQIDDVDAAWNSTSNTISNGTVTLPALVVQIDSENYDAVAVKPPPGVELAYIYEKRQPAADAQLSLEDGDEPPSYLPYSDAEANPLRTIVLPTIDVLAYQNAWSEIYVQRNKILFPIEDVGKISTTEDFLFQTPVVKFADPIVPRLTYTEFPLAAGSGTGDSKLEAALDAFFNGLFSAGNGSTSVEVSMSSAYSYLIQPSQPTMPRIRLPINMLPPTQTPVNPEPPPTFVRPVAATIDAWCASNNPTKEGQPQINFELQVFGASSDKQPLLVVSDLYYQVE